MAIAFTMVLVAVVVAAGASMPALWIQQGLRTDTIDGGFSRLVISTQDIINASTGEVNTQMLPQISEYEVRFLDRDTSYEQLANLDLSIVLAYLPANGSGSTIFGAMTVADSLHKLEWNLTDYPLTLIDSESIQVIRTPLVVGRYLELRDNQSRTQLAAYWNEVGLFGIGPMVQERYFRITLNAYVRDSDYGIPELKSELLAAASALASYWECE